jgi:hypothetical protein
VPAHARQVDAQRRRVALAELLGRQADARDGGLVLGGVGLEAVGRGGLGVDLRAAGEDDAVGRL